MHKRAVFLSIISILLVITLCGCAASPIVLDKIPGVSEPAVQAGVTLPAEPEITSPEPTEPPPPPDTTLPEGKAVTAHHAFVYDVQEERLLFYTGELTDTVYPASVTKLMTSYVVQKNMDLNTKVTVGSEITWIDPYSSVAALAVGDVLTVEQLIEGMMLPSGNDAAYALAVACGRVIAEDPDLDRQLAYGTFIDEMNAEARLLGMQNTHFVTADGNHDENHFTSSNDLIILTKAVLNNDLIMSCGRTLQIDMTEYLGRAVTWHNSNRLLDSQSEYYEPNAIGLKTGSTTAGGACLVSVFAQEGEPHLIVGVFGSNGTDNRYLDTLLLYELYQ